MHSLKIFAAIALAACGSATEEPPTNDPSAFLAYPDGAFLLTNVRIVDGTGAEATEDMDILLRGGMIEEIGTDLSVDEGVARIDLDGHTVLPGLIHLHDHIGYMSSPFRGYEFIVLDPHPFSMPKLYLSAGVTTLRTAGSDAPGLDLGLKHTIERGQAVGPRIFATSAILEGPGTPLLFTAGTEEEGRDFVRRQLALGVSSIKTYDSVPPDALRGVVEEAHANGLHVAGHLGSGTSCAQAARIGIDTVEHAFNSCWQDLPSRVDRDNPFRMADHLEAVDELIAVLIDNDVVMVTTPSGGRRADYSEGALELLAPHMREAIEKIDLKGGERSESGNPLYVLSQKDEARKLERRFVDAGGRLLMGADAMYLPIIPGTSNHDIMIELADHHAPLDVIRMATSDAATFLGIGEETGRVATGFAADLVIVEGAPDQDMSDIRDVALVFREGRAYDPAKLRAAAVGRVGYD